MEISLHLLTLEDAPELFDFESKNRLFFEQMVPSRCDDYYSFDIFMKRHQMLLKEQEDGLSNFYLIKSKAGEILGRINLVDINQLTCSADIGFRIGAEHVGNGIGNHALNLLLEGDLPVFQIHGKTTTVNLASQRVLEKNGFKRLETSKEEFLLNGQKMRFVNYVWERENSSPLLSEND